MGPRRKRENRIHTTMEVAAGIKRLFHRWLLEAEREEPRREQGSALEKARYKGGEGK